MEAREGRRRRRVVEVVRVVEEERVAVEVGVGRAASQCGRHDFLGVERV